MAGEHPLHRSWTFYYDGGSDGHLERSRQQWKAYQKICSVGTVEDFWRLFANLADVGTLDGKKDLFLFEDGIEPDWDHQGNLRGGLWLLHCSHCLGSDVFDSRPSASQDLDSLWRRTVYHTIGEQFSNSTEIVGVALNLRKTGARLAVWTRGSQDHDGLKQIGRELKELVQMPPSKTIGFARHADSKRHSKFFWSGFTGDITV